MTHTTCRLTAKNRDQLWNPTLSNRIQATFTFTFLRHHEHEMQVSNIEEIKQQVSELQQTINTEFKWHEFCMSVYPQVDVEYQLRLG